MAIAFDATSNNGTGSATTWSHTCSGSDRVLVVMASRFSGAADITGVTYNGVAMTNAQSVSDGYRFTSWYLVNPSTGANTIELTVTGSGTLVGGSVSFTGANTSSPVDVIPTYASGTFSLSWTTSYNNSILIDSWMYNGSVTSSPTSPQTQRWNLSMSGPRTSAGSTKTTTTAGAQSTGWTNYGGSFTRTWGIAIREYVASGPANMKSYNTNVKANIKSINTNLIANVKSFDTNV